MKSSYSKAMFLLLLTTLLGACSSTKELGKFYLIIDPHREENKELVKKCPPNSSVEADGYLFINFNCYKVLDNDIQFVGNGAINSRYCGTGFKFQPTGIQGALDNVFYARRSIDGIWNSTVTLETHEHIQCVRVTGSAVWSKPPLKKGS